VHGVSVQSAIDTHVPAWQTSPRLHAAPQALQWRGSLERSTHSSPQSVVGSAQAGDPALPPAPLAPALPPAPAVPEPPPTAAVPPVPGAQTPPSGQNPPPPPPPEQEMTPAAAITSDPQMTDRILAGVCPCCPKSSQALPGVLNRDVGRGIRATRRSLDCGARATARPRDSAQLASFDHTGMTVAEPRAMIFKKAWLSLLFLACSGGSGGGGLLPDGGGPAVCGNAQRETGEACDGVDLGGQSCEGLGFGPGTLGCSLDCNDFDRLRRRCEAGRRAVRWSGSGRCNL
jgi:hypothetical protein